MSKLLIKYNSQRRLDGIQPYLQSTVYPSWWEYNRKGEWVMIDGEKVPVTSARLGDYMVNLQFFEGKDEKGYFIKDYFGNGRTYLNPKDCLNGWNDAEWWAFAQNLKQEKPLQ